MTWFNTKEVGRLQLECTNYCNAACPNATELIWILEIPNNPHTLENYEKWFSKYDWNELTDIQLVAVLMNPPNPELTDLSTVGT